jgi:tRNA(Ile)-lysidine synthase
MVAADNEVLDGLAERGLADATDPDGGLRVATLAELPDAVRRRVLHAWAKGLGVPGAALSHRHVDALDALVTRWHGQGPAHLPGGLTAARLAGVLRRTP